MAAKADNKEIERGQLLVKRAIDGDLEGVRELLDAGVSVNVEQFNRHLFYKSQNYMTPLLHAAKNGHADVLKLLIDHNADLDSKDRFDVTALHLAAENGHVKCLRLLLDAGADCNIPTKYSKYGSYTVPHVGGTTALHLATHRNQINCIRELILNGADYNGVDEFGRNSLYIAAEIGYQDAVVAHLTNAIGKEILSLPVNNTLETPLHECVRHGLESCVTELLNHGSDVNHKNSMGFSPLHLALHNTDKFSMNIVRELVLRGHDVNVNLPDASGTNPLKYVCFHDSCKQARRPRAAVFLIAYGASFMCIKSKTGCSLLQQELTCGVDKTILQAVVKTLGKLPTLASLGIHPAMSRQLGLTAKFQWYMELSTSVRSLQHYCRVCVRDSLGAARLKRIQDLPLPTTLKDYLLLEYDEYR